MNVYAKAFADALYVFYLLYKEGPTQNPPIAPDSGTAIADMIRFIHYSNLLVYLLVQRRLVNDIF